MEEKRLWVNIMKAKYLHGGSFSNCVSSSGGSWTWQATMKCKDLIQKGACLLIGNGVGVDMWDDPWIPSLASFKPTGVGIRKSNVASIADLFLEGLKVWVVDLLNECFEPLSVEAIQKIQPRK